MAFLATAVVAVEVVVSGNSSFWLKCSCNSPMLAPKIPTTASTHLQHLSLPHAGQMWKNQGKEVAAHQCFLKDSLCHEARKWSQLSAPVVQTPLYTTYLPQRQPSLQSKSCLSWASHNVDIEGTWVKLVLSNLFSTSTVLKACAL